MLTLREIRAIDAGTLDLYRQPPKGEQIKRGGHTLTVREVDQWADPFNDTGHSIRYHTTRTNRAQSWCSRSTWNRWRAEQ